MTNPNLKLEYKGESTYQPPQPMRDSQGRKLFPYKPDEGLIKAVNLAIALERPLLLQGDPGCGKTLLARAITYEFGQKYLGGRDEWPYFRWNINSRTQAQDGRYIYDALGRLRDAQMIGTESLKQVLKLEEIEILVKRVKNPYAYIILGQLGKTFRVTTKIEGENLYINDKIYKLDNFLENETDYRPILLIDEIDKADIDFPNDLLAELDEPRFMITETQTQVIAKQNPIVIITSNNERDLPEAFLRRCLFYYVEFPSETRLKEIIQLHFPDKKRQELYYKALEKFLEVRKDGARRNSTKNASTSELLDWIRILSGKTVEEAEAEIENLRKDPSQLGILLKSKADVDRVREL